MRFHDAKDRNESLLRARIFHLWHMNLMFPKIFLTSLEKYLHYQMICNEHCVCETVVASSAVMQDDLL